MASRTYNKYDKYIEKLSKAFKIIDDVESEMDKDIEARSDTDKEISDYLHIIENDEPIHNPTRFIQKIRNARKRRREIIIVTAVSRKLAQMMNRVQTKDGRQLLLAELHKEVKSQQKEYNYRVIDKEEI